MNEALTDQSVASVFADLSVVCTQVLGLGFRDISLYRSRSLIRILDVFNVCEQFLVSIRMLLLV